MLTVIGLNKFAYRIYSFCWRFMNNLEVASSERTGKGAWPSPLAGVVFSGVFLIVLIGDASFCISRR